MDLETGSLLKACSYLAVTWHLKLQHTKASYGKIKAKRRSVPPVVEMMHPRWWVCL